MPGRENTRLILGEQWFHPRVRPGIIAVMDHIDPSPTCLQGFHSGQYVLSPKKLIGLMGNISPDRSDGRLALCT